MVFISVLSLKQKLTSSEMKPDVNSLPVKLYTQMEVRLF